MKIQKSAKRDIARRANIPYYGIKEIERLASFPRLNPNPVLELNMSGSITFCNKAAMDVSKYAGSSGPASLIPKDIRDILRTFKLKKNTPVSVDREVSAGGRVFNERIYMVREYNVVRIYAIDATPKFIAERALEDSEKKLRIIFDGAPDGIAMVDYKTRHFFLWNKAMARYLGCSNGELNKMTIVDIHPRESVREVIKTFERLYRREITLAKDVPIKRRDGSIVYADINSFKISLSGKTYMVGFFRDVTEAKNAKDAMVEWEKRYELIIAVASQVAYDYNIKDGSIRWGGEIKRILGYPPSALQDNVEQWAGKIHPDDRKEAIRLLNIAIRDASEYDAEYRFRHKDGHYMWIRDHGFFIRGPSGQADRMLGLMRDITEAKGLDQIKTELVRAVSHELKTPIGMSKMALDMFRTAMANWDMKRLLESRTILEKNMARLDKDVENILQLFALDSLEKAVIIRRCCVKGVVNDVIKEIRPLANQKHIRILADLPRSSAYIVISKSELKTLVYNLVDNAVKFTQKGTVVVRVRRRKRAVVIIVKDTGIGVIPEHRDRIFKRFFKGHPAMPGTGLGLVICRNITQRHGGTIRLESKGQGRGTKIIVSLPR